MLLQFGIPGLDDLIESPQRRQFVDYAAAGRSKPKNRSRDEQLAEVSARITSESIAILGPDGTGKSVIGLHLASRYAADCSRLIAAERVQRGEESSVLEPPKIIYISSDLRKPAADKIWNSFDLENPDERHIPFERNVEAIRRSKSDPILSVKLKELKPDATQSLVRFLAPVSNAKGDTTQVGFLDLASNTAGDDWNFVNTLLVRLQSISSATIGKPGKVQDENGKPQKEKRSLPHLVIIDSVEGFETFVGRYDSFGNEQTRRARVAQCIRNAGERVHLVFVVEEPKTSEHLAEEYVTDVVLRLRKHMASQTACLTMEVQKARSREHAKGEHPFEIRDKDGTSTGHWENADTPRVRNSYVEVFHSIAHRNRQISLEFGVAEVSRDGEAAGFGLKKLEELLPNVNGLKPGTCTAMIGDPSTGKSVLGVRFLAQGFREVAVEYACLYILQKLGTEVSKDPAVVGAFGSVYKKLSASIILPQSEIQMPGELQKALGDDWEGALPESWLAELKEAYESGETRTSNALEEIFVTYQRRESIPKDVGDALKDLGARKRASELASPDFKSASNVSDTKSKEKKEAPRSRAKWTIEWKKVEERSNDSLVELFYHPNLRFPGVLLTTRDRRGTEIARECLAHLRPELEQDLKEILRRLSSKQSDELFDQLVQVIDTQLIVRRFDMQALPAAAVYHVIQRNLNQANKLIFGVAYPPHQDRRNRKAGRIRMVIDDLRVLSRINPEIVKDGAFLPFLTFHLQREGVVSLLIHSDNILPNRPSGDETTRSLLSMLKSAILTWMVPFEGRSRVAIGVVPHSDPDKNGLVRELRIENGIPVVTRKFELYSGMEEGKPVPVPLAVYIFNETPTFQAYADEEDRLFREVFTSVEGASAVNPSRVIFPIGFQRYQALRDFTHLALDAQDGHTMVFQVDEYWALKEPHILEKLQNYLEEPLPSDREGHILEDPFSLFNGPPQSWAHPQAAAAGAATKPDENPKKSGFSRRDYFHNSGYQPVLPLTTEDESKTNRNTDDETGGAAAKPKGVTMQQYRVPFMWDFGFTLTRSAPWKMAMGEKIYASIKENDRTQGPHHAQTVKNVRDYVPLEGATVAAAYNQLTGEHPNDGTDPNQTTNRRQISWRKFLGACKQVADVHYQQTGAPTVPFDVACPSSETMNALIFEIWRSEMDMESKLLGVKLPWKKSKPGSRGKTKAENEPDTFVLSDWLEFCPNNKGAAGLTISTLFQKFHDEAKPKLGIDFSWSKRCAVFKDLPLGAFCMYKTWLLLIEVLQFEEFLDDKSPFTFRADHSASLHAVASRHWYKTACAFSQELYNSDGIHDSVVAMRLPGNYSTRGDWFLGSPKSSRSKLLAQHAMDLMCSRRANLARLQHGLGLPVRDVLKDDACKQLRTALRCKMPRDREKITGMDNIPEETMSEHSSEIEYGKLCLLGKPADAEAGTEFDWLWRRNIDDYDRLGRPMQKWLVRLFRWTRDYRMRRSRHWVGGFGGYDELTAKRFDSVAGYPSFLEFGGLCDLLCAELKAASRAEGNR